MKLRTEIDIPSHSEKIDYRSKLYFTGSCFSEHIANYLTYYGFNVQSNSHGIIYNPVSIFKSVEEVLECKNYHSDDLLNHEGKFLSLHHHGSYDGKDEKDVLHQINHTIAEHGEFLKSSSVVFISLGTSWVYEWVESGNIVANCHKLPGTMFKKRILKEEEIYNSVHRTIDIIHEHNKEAAIIFTVSPVKHLSDGFIGNQWSKSLLHTAIQKVCSDKVSYFPAYEIMVDDLRDYRFWSADMMHPNELAIEYIWAKFHSTFMKGETEGVMKEVKKLRQFLAHRPLSNNPEDIHQLEEEKELMTRNLKQKYPMIKL